MILRALNPRFIIIADSTYLTPLKLGSSECAKKWHLPSEMYGTFVSISVKLTLGMQIIGFSVRLSSSLLWMQMYRLGASYIDNLIPRDTDVDLRNSFLSPATPSIVRHLSGSDVGGSRYDSAYYTSLFEDGRDDAFPYGGGKNHGISVVNSVLAAETSNLDPSMGRSSHAKDDENAVRKSELV
ncbi:UNVERIFIED_CONTAM: hypothetical protein Scaly_0337000 [Sesamum calycinum]|uniref:Uncharacterized protein n=1 Tax=Sesamum calycinum TaxID=2727403 RepID=A0AAW2SBN1_9LAMI